MVAIDSLDLQRLGVERRPICERRNEIAELRPWHEHPHGLARLLRDEIDRARIAVDRLVPDVSGHSAGRDPRPEVRELHLEVDITAASAERLYVEDLKISLRG